MEYSFKNHPLSDAEKLWLQEVAKQNHFDPKVAKVRLLGKLPPDFNPHKIDRRLYANGRLTAIGLWYVDSQHPIFHAMDQVISYIRKRIIEAAGIEQFTAKDIADATKIDENLVARALYEIGQLGSLSFYSTASGTSGDMFTSISLISEYAYDEYLDYKGIDHLLEKVYVAQNPSSKRLSFADTILDTIDSEDIVKQSMERISIKSNTAFVLMAIDPKKPDLEDIYNTIKRVCKEFGINAYRADEIEHQDRITDVILREISACEFLIADLSYERPNVYYEVGYAHAISKKPILYRRNGTPLHFDLSVHNVPEYSNVTELEELLRRRLEAILGRKAKSS